ncbi:MAG: LptF/LptG family permease [Tannerellaceae bacterium]|jgi:lipopolysaccharide export system permease protein|nr:LptF/LptG family permease [Tannerellaceae bacterium]
MLKIKRLYTFMLQTFLPLFIMTFGICLFIVLMQFLWKYIDEMVGKGLDMLVLGEMFFYAALSLVPMALPLAILLSSLMTFGALGERLELLAMKSAGISLIHIMRPLIIFICFIGVGAFFFQNNIMPVAQVKLWSLLYSIRQKSPELDIPEGVFFNEIRGYNLYVRQKEQKTGLLKNLMIYDYSAGFNNVMIMVADSGRLKTSADKLFLVLSLHNGEAFQNQNTKRQSGSAQAKEAVPYRRESFLTKEILIEFDANFTRTDESYFQNQYIGKNLDNLQTSIDSMSVRLDSIKTLYSNDIYTASYKKSFPGSIAPQAAKVINFDSAYQAESPSSKAALLSRVKSSIEYVKSDYFFKSASVSEEATRLRRHYMEWHTKFTISFACLVFFFIGAPLGAIIRKGGLGTPVVLSIILFIFYYVINNIGGKMARDGVWPVWEGMWFSSAILTVLGIFLTYKAVNDSVILNADTYVNTLKNLIGKRTTRKVERKEVIIYTPDYEMLIPRLEALAEKAGSYLSHHKRWLNYLAYWREGGQDSEAGALVGEIEHIVEELANSDQNLVLNKLMDYPIIGGYPQLGAQLNPKLSLAIGLCLPLGLPLYFFAVYRRKLLMQDLRTARKTSEELKDIIINLTNANLRHHESD